MTKFEDLSLIEPIAKALREANYTTPTAIQAKTIPHALNQRDVLGCAQTGTGKTAAFALPILNALGNQNQKAVPNQPRALVLAPTRELASQIESSFAQYGQYLPLRTCVIYGGVSQHKQVRALARGMHIVVATPGRLLDLIAQGHIDLSRLSFFVLDEADRMLDMGFLPDINRIISMLPKQRQSLFFSATVAPPIVKLAKKLLKNRPIGVNVTPKKTSVAKITQEVIHTESRNKHQLLKRLLTRSVVDRAMVFTRTKRGANVVAQALRDADVAATAIHGNKSQNARERALSDLREGKITVLVATDVASRGIDIEGITHVVNFDLPREPEAYVHRIGRTGRAGREGIAIAFCTPAERSELKAIERLIGHKLPVGENGASEPTTTLQRPSNSGSHAAKKKQSRPKSDNGQTASAQPAARRSRHTRRRTRNPTAVATK
ncbi:DEAD/DEAH box helicase [Fuerstiella marisgermanici]|uniref:ATP-dependent RNA helicase RhlE n=1 Tax=Fuerstiella marisgermanici TaxID=1891926 RepID=A0A1P8WR28_9PLAN|nr:DEAD/DEAH box helicase [Fuerstiella marisgermanici]APZ96478.1 ATP-dependent RNA helicase RhlE [Fuerstiella marisgermanici]